MKIVSSILAAGLGLAFSTGAALAEWPEKPIQILIPWPAANDPSTLVATAMAPVMSEKLGVPVKVINKPGGGAVLGAAELARARPDGHTIGLVSVGPMITQVARGKTPYQLDDFEPIGLVWASPFTLATRADAPYSNLKELAVYAADNEVRLAHWGIGAVPTLIAMNYADKAGFEWQETAYEQLNPLVIDQGDADVITYSTTGLTDYVESGKMKLLAAMVPDRLPAYPDLPNVAEQGYGPAFSVWFGAFAPKGTDEKIVDILSEAIFAAIEDSEVQKVIGNVGVVPESDGPSEAKARMQEELTVFTDLMNKLGVME